VTEPAGSRRRGLGMGLSALLAAPADLAGPPAAVETLPIERLRPSPVQPRRRFAEGELAALAASIGAKGVLQPLLVRPAPGEDYEIVAGERRWRAAQLAGQHEVPVVVRELADGEALELALVENLQRADLSPFEEAEALRRLIEEFGHSQEALGEALGRSRSHIANTLRLLALPDPVRAMVEDGSLTAGHARALLGTPDPQRLALQVVTRGLNVRQTEALVRQAGRARHARPADPNLAALERDLAQRLGMHVAIRRSGTGGVLTLRYSRPEQLERILRRLV
jgi:ParB family chromosome partitioning protein